MPPTEQQLENRRLASQGQPVITADSLETQSQPIDFQTFQEPALPPIPALQLTQPEKEVSAAQKEIQRLQGQTVGQSARRTALEGEADIEGLTQTEQDLQARVTSLTAEAQQIPLQLQEESTGRGITTGGLQPLQTARLRTNAIQSLGANAQLQAAQGNLTTALDLIDRKVAAEFDPIFEELNVKRSNLELLLQSPELTLADKNRANEQVALINEKQAQAEAQASEEKAKQEAISNAISFGADIQTIRQMGDVSSEEALMIAVEKGYVDKGYILDQELKKVELKQKKAQLEVFQRYGGLTPTQYLAQIEKQQNDIKVAEQETKEATKAAQQSAEDALLIDDNIAKADAILNSKGLDTVVGPTFLTRGIARQKQGFIGKTGAFITKVATLPVGLIHGLESTFDEVSGNADDTVKLAQQMIDQQFLDKLIDVKSKGATFGALSDNEGNALRNAANAIAGAAIKDKNDNVIGYDMSEKLFKEEISGIKKYLEIARVNATGEAFNQDEKDLLDNTFGDDEDFDPSFE